MITLEELEELPNNFTILMNLSPDTHLNAYEILDLLHTKGICVTLHRPATNLKDLLEKKGFKIENIHFVDCISRTAGLYSELENCEYTGAPHDLTRIGIAIDRAVEKLGAGDKFLIFDSLPTLLIYHDEKIVLEFMNFLINRLRSLRIKGVIFSTEKELSKKMKNRLSEFCDKVVNLSQA